VIKEVVKKVDLIVVGSGLSALNFIDTYLDSHKKIHVISPKKLKKIKNKKKRILPAQMKSEQNDVDKYFYYNNFFLNNNCKVLGVLNSGGLSNYWGLQMDNEFYNDQKNINKKLFNDIQKNFRTFLVKYGLIGQFKKNRKIIYNNNFKIPNFLQKILDLRNSELKCEKPILAFLSKNLKMNNLNNVKEEKSKLTSKNFFNKIKKKGKIISHNYYVKKIYKDKKKIRIVCNNFDQKEVTFLANKVVFASGTLATTKIIIDFLKVNKEIKVKHHQRLLSVFLAKKSLRYNLDFTPSVLQIKSKSGKFCADVRPGNELITESLIDAYPFYRPFKFFFNFIKSRMIFSNILLDSSHSNIFIKKTKEKFEIYSKKTDAKDYLRQSNKKIFKFLFENKIIFPIFKTLYPGPGADYHYFGTIPFNNNGKLSVNDKCQLKSNKNIYIIDGSVFNFKSNKYPLGWVIANARRIGKLI